MQGPQSKRNLAAWLTAFFLVALGAKLWTIQIWATNIPYWDQWDEARLLFKPWLEGTLTWHDFFIPHNEHRILFTRLLDLLEVKLNGQWDIYLQTVVNAFLHLAFGCGLATAIWHFTGRKHAGLICFLLLPFFALPFAAENTLHGFQSQFYFASLFSVAAILGLGFSQPGGKGWFVGLLLAVLVIFTMASGFLAAAAVVGLVILRSAKQRSFTRGQMFTTLGGLAVIALGLAMKVSVAQHEKFQAKTVSDFFSALAGNLAWPFSDQPAMALLFCLPLALVAVRYFQVDVKNPRAAEFVLVLGGWGILQAAALAFGRANLAESSRYLDTLSTLPIASVAGLFVLAEDAPFQRLPQKLTLALAIVWSGILLTGLVQSARMITDHYSQWSHSRGLLETENVRAFIATDDAGWLKSKISLDVPYWNSDWLVELLRQPKMLSIMPADARPALKLEMDEVNSTGFARRAYPPENPGQPFTTTWSDATTDQTFSTNRFVSLPLITDLPKISIQIFCSPAANAKIRLVASDSGGGLVAELNLPHSARWETVITGVPQSPFILEIEKNSSGSTAPVAIGEMKELGCFSVLAQSTISQATNILLVGLGVLIGLTAAALARPGISFANDGGCWLLVLITGLTVFIGVWCGRGLDATGYNAALHQNLAVEYLHASYPECAEIQLREALWLRPGDTEAKNALRILKAGRPTESLPKHLP